MSLKLTQFAEHEPPQLHLIETDHTRDPQTCLARSIIHALGDTVRYNDMISALENHQSDDPLHIIYPDKIVEQAHVFTQHFKGDVYYAVKANPSPVYLRLAWIGGITCYDVASIREIELVRRTLPTAQMAFMHPVKSRFAIKKAYGMGLRIFAFDHADELDKILDETDGAQDLTLVLRLAVSEENKAVFSLAGKYGATGAEAVSLLQKASKTGNKVGISFHVGSQCMDPNSFKSALMTASKAVTQAGIRVSILDVGGGFPVVYPGMAPRPTTDYIKTINKAVVKFPDFKDAQILCEPGRALVATAGSVLVRVEHRRGRALYLNDGTYGSLFDAGTPRWNYPVTVLRPGAQKPKTNATTPLKTEAFEFFGPTCDSIDHMKGPFSVAADVKEGDWLEIGHIGAYGQTMQTGFNGFYSNDAAAIWPAHTELSQDTISGVEK